MGFFLGVNAGMGSTGTARDKAPGARSQHDGVADSPRLVGFRAMAPDFTAPRVEPYNAQVRRAPPDARTPRSRTVTHRMSRTRQLIVWVCMAASLWMGAGYPLHGLSHALQAAHVRADAYTSDGARDHERRDQSNHAAHCEQCGLFAALDGAAPSAPPPAMAMPTGTTPGTARVVSTRAVAFTAYAPRAPPALA